MPYSSGTFDLYTPGNPVVTGATIASSWANNTLTDIATGLSSCILKDGTQTITADIPMAGFKITGLAAGSAAGDSIRYEQIFTAGTTLTATGSVQSDALQLAAAVNQVTTTAAGTGVKLYASPIPGSSPQIVYNGGANPLKIYPQVGGSINQLATNASMTLPMNTSVAFYPASSTFWIGLLSA